MSDPQTPPPNPRVPAAQGRADSRVPPPTGGPAPKREAPARPPLASPNAPPVVANVTPPVSVRFAQLFWILSFAVGGFAVVYFFIIRETQLPLIADVVRGVTEGRSEETYTTAADIIFWSVFGALVAILLIQITLMVSFMGRRPRVRWWQMGTVLVQALLLVLSIELVAGGSDGEFLRQLLAIQVGLALLGLLISTLPPVIAWTARGVDVRRGPSGDARGTEL